MDYMIISYPRSRSTWLANFLTYQDSICLHDPLAQMNFKELEERFTGKRFGIADTSLLYLDAAYLNRIDCKRLIIHRNLRDVRKSLGIDIQYVDLNDVDGLHVDFEDINNRIEEIWEYCLGYTFDAERFKLLKDMNIQPHFEGMTPANQDKIKEFVAMLDSRSRRLC